MFERLGYYYELFLCRYPILRPSSSRYTRRIMSSGTISSSAKFERMTKEEKLRFCQDLIKQAANLTKPSSKSDIHASTSKSQASGARSASKSSKRPASASGALSKKTKSSTATSGGPSKSHTKSSAVHRSPSKSSVKSSGSHTVGDLPVGAILASRRFLLSFSHTNPRTNRIRMSSILLRYAFIVLCCLMHAVEFFAVYA